MRWPDGSVLIATKNQGKVREFAAVFEKLGRPVISLRDVDGAPDIVEDGTTFAENAAKKALAAAHFWNLPVVADDSGLCVDLLGGAPGVYSARYAGEAAADEANNRKLLDELRRVVEAQDSSAAGSVIHSPTAGTFRGNAVRSGKDGSFRLLSPARYVCALVYYDPASRLQIVAEGECGGWIIDTPAGNNGFGYDPLFYVPEFGKTMAELDMEEKNRISHRGRALQKLFEQLRARMPVQDLH